MFNDFKDEPMKQWILTAFTIIAIINTSGAQIMTKHLVAANYSQPGYNVSATGIAAYNKDGGAEIYPNPIDDRMYVRLHDINGPSTILVKDVIGKTIFMQNVDPQGRSAQYEVDLSGKPGGLYFVEVRNGDDLVYTGRVVKQ